MTSGPRDPDDLAALADYARLPIPLPVEPDPIRGGDPADDESAHVAVVATALEDKS